MPKKPLSVTLESANLVWLRGRAAATGRRSVSDLLDALVTEARLAGRAADAPSRSVVGTVDIAADDPDLARADDEIGRLFAQSLSRPILVREPRVEYERSGGPTQAGKRRG